MKHSIFLKSLNREGTDVYSLVRGTDDQRYVKYLFYNHKANMKHEAKRNRFISMDGMFFHMSWRKGISDKNTEFCQTGA